MSFLVPRWKSLIDVLASLHELAGRARAARENRCATPRRLLQPVALYASAQQNAPLLEAGANFPLCAVNAYTQTHRQLPGASRHGDMQTPGARAGSARAPPQTRRAGAGRRPPARACRRARARSRRAARPRCGAATPPRARPRPRRPPAPLPAAGPARPGGRGRRPRRRAGRPRPAPRARAAGAALAAPRPCGPPGPRDRVKLGLGPRVGWLRRRARAGGRRAGARWRRALDAAAAAHDIDNRPGSPASLGSACWQSRSADLSRCRQSCSRACGPAANRSQALAGGPMGSRGTRRSVPRPTCAAPA